MGKSVASRSIIPVLILLILLLGKGYLRSNFIFPNKTFLKRF